MREVMFRCQSLAELINDCYNLHHEVKYVSMFEMTNPVIMICNPDLIKSISLKNFDIFPDSRTFFEEHQEPLLSKNLSSLKKNKCRQVRLLLNPAFTSSKMKSMFKLMSDCGAEFSNYLAQLPPEKRIMEIKEVLIRLSIVMPIFHSG